MIIELISCAAKPSFPIIILLGFYSDFKEGLGFCTLISENTALILETRENSVNKTTTEK